MTINRLKHTDAVDELAADIFFSQIAGEPHLASWGIKEYAEVCLNYLRVSFLPEPWLRELVDAVVKFKEGRL